MRSHKVLATLSETFWLLVLGVVAMFAFFAALGAFEIGEAIGVTIAVVVLAALWLAHAMWVAPQRRRDPAAVRARERRGFWRPPRCGPRQAHTSPGCPAAAGAPLAGARRQRRPWIWPAIRRPRGRAR